MIKFKKGLSVALALTMALTIGGIVQGNDALAAKKVKLSNKKLTIKVGSTKKLTLKNSKKKAKWSISKGKKYITLKSKKKKSVVIKAKKAGSAVVVAKVGKKKYKCKITVKKKTKTTTTTTTTTTKKATATPTPANSGNTSNSGSSSKSGDSASSTSTATPTPTPIVDVKSFSMKNESFTAVKTASDPTPELDIFSIEPATAAAQVQYDIEDQGIVKYDETTKKLLAVGTGTTNVKVTTGDKEKSGSCIVSVKKDTSAVHDPSIFKDPNAETPTYYTIGTGLGFAKSSDLQEWTSLPGGSNLFKNGSSELDEVFSYIGENYNMGLVWAGDMIYNKKMKKYCIYACLGGGSQQVIFLMTSENPEKDYEYEGMVVCSGINESNIQKSNLFDTLELSSLEEVPARYLNNHISDAIDPQPFYDGNDLYLTWGAFANDSCIHLLKLDPRTGLRKPSLNYDYVESGDEKADPYYGKYLTAPHQGEGGYIVKVKDTSGTAESGYWYYLYTSNGNLNAPRTSGSYRMTVFRSENVEGPYVDMNGNKALDNKNNGTDFLYNYKFNFMDMAFVAMGHNSAMYDEETGKLFIEYHNKFSDGSAAPGTHMIKTHQMFINSQGWPVVAPFEYHGEELGTVSKRKVAGRYEIIIHNQSSAIVDGSYNYIKSQIIELDKEGNVTGALSGQWTMNEETGAFAIETSNGTYDGYILEQYEDDSAAAGQISSGNKTIVFTGAGKGLKAIYGSKVSISDEDCVKYDLSKLSVAEEADADFTLPTVGAYGSTITWTSNSDVITITGSKASIHPDVIDQTVILTASAESNDSSDSKIFNVKVARKELKISTIVVTDTIDLPDTFLDYPVVWESSDDGIIDSEGKVTRQAASPQKVKLTATVGENLAKYEFDMLVLPTAIDSDESWNSIYTQDFQNLSKITDVFTSTSNGNGLTLATRGDSDQYMNFDMANAGSGNRGCISTNFTGLSGDESLYKMDFDLLMNSGNVADRSQSRFVITSVNDTVATAGNNGTDITTNYLFKLSTAWNSTTWTLNDGNESVDIPANTWVHVNLLVQKDSVVATITNGDTTIGQYNLEIKGESNIAKNIYILGGRGSGLVKLDNIIISKYDGNFE